MTEIEYLKPGLHPDVPMRTYVGDPCPEPSLSKGVIETLIMQSPAHAHHEHPRLGGNGDSFSPRADLGSAAHAKLLGGDQAVQFIDADSYRTKAAKEERAKIRLKNAIPMLIADEPILDAMASIARPLLEEQGPGDAEHTLVWEKMYQEKGIWFRTRPDWVSEDRLIVLDYKTAKTADPQKWIKTSLNGSAYDIGAALVLRGMDEVFGQANRQFIWLVQEIDPPHCCSLISPSPDRLDLANRKIDAGVRIWRKSMAENDWPGYDKRVHWAELPEWQVWDWENRAAAYGEGSQ